MKITAAWKARCDWSVVCRRASGRRRYNAARKRLRDLRRVRIICDLPFDKRGRRGVQAQLARELGVSPATISRDFKAIRNAHLGALLK